MTLSKNKIYSTTFFKQNYGGNVQCSMPIVNGTVPYCKFDPKINWNFPNEAWIEDGPIRYKSAMILAEQTNPIPVFKKIERNKWAYIGLASVHIRRSERYKDQLNIKPPRNKIQIILVFNFI